MVAETGTSSDNDREFLRQTKRGTCEFKFKVNFCTVSASGKPCIVSQSSSGHFARHPPHYYGGVSRR